MTKRMTILLLAGVVGLLAGGEPLRAAQPAWSGTTETAAPDTEAVAETSSASASPAAGPPHFDHWAKQPRLGCHVPAIRAWTVLEHIEADPDAPPDPLTLRGKPQRILIQGPPGERGLSKYTVIYQPLAFDPANAGQWYRNAMALRTAIQQSLEKTGVFRTVEVGKPLISSGGELQRMQLTYRVETRSGGGVSGLYLVAPALNGLLSFNLAVEGVEPDALNAPMRELRLAVTRGLTKEPRGATPYVVVFLLALPIAAAAVIALRKRRIRALGTEAKSRAERRQKR